MPRFPEGRAGQYAATAVATLAAAALAEGVAHTALDEFTTTAAEHNAQVTRCAEALGPQAVRTFRFPEACDPLQGDFDFQRKWRRQDHANGNGYDTWLQKKYDLPAADTFRTTEHRDVATDPTNNRVDAASILAGALAGGAAAAGMIVAGRRRRERAIRD